MKIISCGKKPKEVDNLNLRAAQLRHIPILGESAQERLSELTIGVIGLGGIGSELIEKLKRLFPKRLVLVDDDFIEETNLNRVVGSTFSDAKNRLRKTNLALREVATFNPKQEVRTVFGNFLDEEVQLEFKNCDVIFSSTDNVASRFAACAFGLANGCAVIDVATGIIMNDSAIKAAGGQVIWLTASSNWCPLCSGLYDQREIATGLLDSQELERQRAQGYVHGENIAAPQVGSLNGILAGLAVWMFMRLVSGASIDFDGVAVDALTFTTHAWSEERLSPNNCHYCGEHGSLMRGDSAEMVCRTKAISLPELIPSSNIESLPTRSVTQPSNVAELPVSAMFDLLGLRQYTH